MSFDDRITEAVAFESKLLEYLKAMGYQAYHFGQAQLPEECRKLLKNYEDDAGRPCLIRWMPDIIAFRIQPGRRVWVCLIDAKVSSDDQRNYAVEVSAVETAELWTDRFYTPTFFVFSDKKVLIPREVRQRGTPGRVDHGTRGSGTPYLLVDKRWGQPFVKFFPPVDTDRMHVA